MVHGGFEGSYFSLPPDESRLIQPACGDARQFINGHGFWHADDQLQAPVFTYETVTDGLFDGGRGESLACAGHVSQARSEVYALAGEGIFGMLSAPDTSLAIASTFLGPATPLTPLTVASKVPGATSAPAMDSTCKCRTPSLRRHGHGCSW